MKIFFYEWHLWENKENSLKIYSMPDTVLGAFQKSYVSFKASRWSKYESFYRWGNSNLERTRKGQAGRTRIPTDRVSINKIWRWKWKSQTKRRRTTQEARQTLPRRYKYIMNNLVPSHFGIYVFQHLQNILCLFHSQLKWKTAELIKYPVNVEHLLFVEYFMV